MLQLLENEVPMHRPPSLPLDTDGGLVLKHPDLATFPKFYIDTPLLVPRPHQLAYSLL